MVRVPAEIPLAYPTSLSSHVLRAHLEQPQATTRGGLQSAHRHSYLGGVGKTPQVTWSRLPFLPQQSELAQLPSFLPFDSAFLVLAVDIQADSCFSEHFFQLAVSSVSSMRTPHWEHWAWVRAVFINILACTPIVSHLTPSHSFSCPCSQLENTLFWAQFCFLLFFFKLYSQLASFLTLPISLSGGKAVIEWIRGKK